MPGENSEDNHSSRNHAADRRKPPGEFVSEEREALNDFVGGNGTVPVHEMVQVPGGELGLVGERAVGDALLLHQPLERRPEWLRAEASASRHYAGIPTW